MHKQAMDFVRGCVMLLPTRRGVVEFGSRDVNGSVRPLFSNADWYTGVDAKEGRGVDVVADAATWCPNRPCDTVVCCEVLEHAPGAKTICQNAHAILQLGGVFIVTAATVGRGGHSAVDGNELRPGEYYGNIAGDTLREWLSIFSFSIVDVRYPESDVYALAVK